jgi:hypothetical protein
LKIPLGQSPHERGGCCLAEHHSANAPGLVESLTL